MANEIISGFHSVNEMIKANRRKVMELFILDEKPTRKTKGIVESARELGHANAVKKLSRQKMDELVGDRRHQGVAARVGACPLVSLDEIVEKEKTGDPFILVLDQVLDAHNLGAIIRTAVCAGVDGVIIPKDRSAKPSPAVSRISAGGLEHVLLSVVTNLVNTLKELKKKGVWISGLDAAAKQALYSGDFNMPLAFVIGGEESGIRPLVKKQCDFLFSIPQTGYIDSLNASVAAGVVMYEVVRQKNANKANA